jgi:hypothetical protein
MSGAAPKRGDTTTKIFVEIARLKSMTENSWWLAENHNNNVHLAL